MGGAGWAALFLLRHLHQWFLGPWFLEGHAAAEHPGWTATYELLRPYPNQRQRVVYHRNAPPAD